MSRQIRVRFAPSPTGYMHLGNVRAALLNFLFARQKQGVFIVRIEDTDEVRNLDEAGSAILHDLAWLGLTHDEGPDNGGPYSPYLQSERLDVYQNHLNDLIGMQKVYRCFCTVEALEEQRKQQLAAGKPPRYSRTCLYLSAVEVEEKIKKGLPFLWRFMINHEQIVTIHDMARGTVTFDLQNFSDFTLTRPDGSFTFLFTNFVDDFLMDISHVIRGEDHLSNTALQATLYDAFALALPTFWHLPIICNAEGKKLSKRDFGFALHDLQSAGYLPETICNYLALIGRSDLNEVQNLDELIQSFNFEHMHATGGIRYDNEKLKWLNHKWIQRLSPRELVERTQPFLHEAVPASITVRDRDITDLLGVVKTDMKTLRDSGDVCRFYFEEPDVQREVIEEHCGIEITHKVLEIITSYMPTYTNADQFLTYLTAQAKQHGLPTKALYSTVRYLLTGTLKGISLHELLGLLNKETLRLRLTRFR